MLPTRISAAGLHTPYPVRWLATRKSQTSTAKTPLLAIGTTALANARVRLPQIQETQDQAPEYLQVFAARHELWALAGCCQQKCSFGLARSISATESLLWLRRRLRIGS